MKNVGEANPPEQIDHSSYLYKSPENFINLQKQLLNMKSFDDLIKNIILLCDFWTLVFCKIDSFDNLSDYEKFQITFNEIFLLIMSHIRIKTVDIMTSIEDKEIDKISKRNR